MRWLLAIVFVAAAARGEAYSVLAHEAIVDAAWNTSVRPVLLQRFPATTDAALQAARAYAYGGSVIQDLGYYPFGSHFFSNLLHYVRSGDFVETLIAEARDVNELAFALGALAHYAADNEGHVDAVNPALPLMFPKLRRKYGNRVTYAQAPATHVLVEFSFDVARASEGAYVPQAYHDAIGFEVSTDLLERAFRRTYGLEVKDVFGDEDLAIGTYRHAVAELVPELSRIAAGDNRDRIFRFSRAQYKREFGDRYARPAWFVRVAAFVYKVVPKVGPLRPLRFEAPTPETERLFSESFVRTVERYRRELASARAGRLQLAHTDFDTGKAAVRGEYPLADEAFRELLDRLAARHFADVSEPLRRCILTFFRSDQPWPELSAPEVKRDDNVRRQLTLLAFASS